MESDSIKRISVWSGPRNISTALMYSFAQRDDTKVFDEPLYAYYLKNSNAKDYHPGADEIVATMENDGDKVVDMMMTASENQVLFFKNMTHHLLNLDRSFMKQLTNVILTRDPRDMLPSFDKVIKNPSLYDVGYKLHVELIAEFIENDIDFIVLDSKNVLSNPEAVLRQLCDHVRIAFDNHMLKWLPSKRLEDGVWAKYWYDSVHKSSGFLEYEPNIEPFPKHLEPLLKECLPYYEKLQCLALS
ncbi:MAG: sulfotransferase family protein [Psychroserpens sp.]|uniref:sulfotransferase-like domain-containing protein n=1 Tax=Psychroserpens sp. TaxID=2020870 RepID=UPI003C707DE3